MQISRNIVNGPKSNNIGFGRNLGYCLHPETISPIFAYVLSNTQNAMYYILRSRLGGAQPPSVGPVRQHQIVACFNIRFLRYSLIQAQCFYHQANEAR